jgi:vitamin-K-epoxide reductase (warfarin-sensitive)
VRYLLAFLALCGIVVASLALQIHNSTTTAPCSINEHWDCGVVNHSEFAEIRHVPVATLGIAGYALLGVLALFRLRTWHLVASLLGLAFSLRLTYIEKNVLQVWCLYCVISQAIILLIAVFSVAWWMGHRRRRHSDHRGVLS